ncbi:MAG: hypothetical protein HOI47_02280 [Candidatus Scalindua sp.]|jgi:hypothetical protein|nr:hypothetical protein [Candidatus Scalindua sp.]
MKKLLIVLLLILFSADVYAQDTKGSALSDISSPTSGDDMYIIDDPDGTPLSKKINIGALLGVATDLDSGGAVSSNAVALTTDTTGNYAAGDAEAGAATNIQDNLILAADMADADHGDVAWTSNVAAVEGVAANAVTLGTDTTGNYAATVADAGNSTITVANSGAETAAITLDLTANGVDDTHIDWGTGASQVSLDDMTEGTSTNYYVHNAWNGTFKEAFDADVTSNGSVVTMSIEKTGTGDLTTQFSSGIATYDCTPADTIALTVGSDASPQGNWIYILQSAPSTLVKSTTAWPATEHIKIGFFFVQSAATVQSAGGPIINQNWNNELFTTDSQGHVSHVGEKIRALGPSYFSGIDGNGATASYYTLGASNSEFISTSGVMFQMHKQTFPAFDTSTGSTIHVVNSSVSGYRAITDLFSITTDSTGATITNNKYFNLVLWGVINKTGEHQVVMCNVPGGFYNSSADAQNDVSSYDVFTIPREFALDSSNGFLICRTTFQMGTTWSHVATVDLRGSTPQSATGGAAGVATTFADNVFDIFDNTDNTKVMAFDVGTNITTGTTRTLKPLDKDYTIGDLLADGSVALAGAWSMGSQATTNVNIDTGTIAGAVTGTTQSASDNSTKLATTAYADAAGGAFSDASDPIVQNTTTKDTAIGTTHNNTAKLSVDGDADQILVSFQGNATQTSSLTVWEQSDGTDLIKISNSGDMEFGSSTHFSEGQITQDTGQPLDISLGSATGDDFTIDTSRLVVAGDDFAVGIGTVTPNKIATSGSVITIDSSHTANQIPYVEMGKVEALVDTEIIGSFSWYGNTGPEQMAFIRVDAEGTAGAADMIIGVGSGASVPTRMTIDGTSGLVNVVNEFTAGTKTFKIDHPLDPNNKLLYHMAIEGPRIDLIYRGNATLVNGKATVNLDIDSCGGGNSMMAGTFVALTQNAVVTSLHNQDGFSRVKSSPVIGATFDIECEDIFSTDVVSWVVMAERNDPFVRAMSKTDANGRFIPEHDKPLPDMSRLETEYIDTDDPSRVGDVVESVQMNSKGYKIHAYAYGEELPKKTITTRLRKKP